MLVGIGVGLTFRRYTPEGAEVAARCKALKHWLEDFTRLKEAIPSDLILWNKLLVMGVALGVSKEVLRQLAEAVPADLRNSDDFYDNYPCYWWYYHHYGNESPLDSFNDVYHETIRELASSSDSSSGGSGGGFSGGGGGGVGGGGGGCTRVLAVVNHGMGFSRQPSGKAQPLFTRYLRRLSPATSHLRTSPTTRCGCCQGVSRGAGIKGTSLTARFRLLGRVRRGSFRAACRDGALRGWRGAWPCA
ncbi:MAG: DUF2207 family protein [Collinsella sp.]